MAEFTYAKGRILDSVRFISDEMKEFQQDYVVMDPDHLFVMVLKNPEQLGLILERLPELTLRLRDVYVDARADYVVIAEGSGTAISPRSFNTLLMPCLTKIFAKKVVPHLLSLMGRSDKIIEMILSCEPDAIGVDQECSLPAARSVVPKDLPIFSI